MTMHFFRLTGSSSKGTRRKCPKTMRFPSSVDASSPTLSQEGSVYRRRRRPVLLEDFFIPAATLHAKESACRMQFPFVGIPNHGIQWRSLRHAQPCRTVCIYGLLSDRHHLFTTLSCSKVLHSRLSSASSWLKSYPGCSGWERLSYIHTAMMMMVVGPSVSQTYPHRTAARHTVS